MSKAALCVVLLWASVCHAAADGRLKVRVSWGHTAAAPTDYRVAVSGRAGLEVRSVTPHQFDTADVLQSGVAQTRAGNGDIDGLDLALEYPLDATATIQNVHILWTDLIAASDGDTARRLSRDPAFKTRPPSLTVQLDAAGTRGFTVSIEQLLVEKALWIPSLDMYLAAGDEPLTFEAHTRVLALRRGQRMLDRLRTEPEATYAEYTAKWEDLGNPAYSNPQSRGPGHRCDHPPKNPTQRHRALGNHDYGRIHAAPGPSGRRPGP